MFGQNGNFFQLKLSTTKQILEIFGHHASHFPISPHSTMFCSPLPSPRTLSPLRRQQAIAPSANGAACECVTFLLEQAQFHP
jgi:hypothetical protein